MPNKLPEPRIFIEMDEKTRIRRDEIQIILERKRINGKTKEESWVPQAYFGRMEHLFNYILEKKILQKHHKNFKALAAFMIKTKAELKVLINIKLDDGFLTTKSEALKLEACAKKQKEGQ